MARHTSTGSAHQKHSVMAAPCGGSHSIFVTMMISKQCKQGEGINRGDPDLVSAGGRQSAMVP